MFGDLNGHKNKRKMKTLCGINTGILEWAIYL